MSRSTTKPSKWPVRPAKTQISLGIRPVWSESSLCAQWVAKDPDSFMHTVKTLIRLGGFPGWSESSLGAQVILLILSCGGLCNLSLDAANPTKWHVRPAKTSMSIRIHAQFDQSLLGFYVYTKPLCADCEDSHSRLTARNRRLMWDLVVVDLQYSRLIVLPCSVWLIFFQTTLSNNIIIYPINNTMTFWIITRKGSSRQLIKEHSGMYL